MVAASKVMLASWPGLSRSLVQPPDHKEDQGGKRRNKGKRGKEKEREGERRREKEA